MKICRRRIPLVIFSSFGGATCEQSLWKTSFSFWLAMQSILAHIFTLFLTILKRNKYLSSIPSTLDCPLFQVFPLISPFHSSAHLRISPSMCVSGWNCGRFLRRSVWAQWRRFVVGLSYNVQSFFRTLHTLMHLMLHGSKSTGEFLCCTALTCHFPHPTHPLCPLNLCT